MTMSPRDFFRELAYPAGSSSTLIALATFVLLLLLAMKAGMLGIWLAIGHIAWALFFGITIIGLPIAAQHLKMTRLALLPFGFEVREMR